MKGLLGKLVQDLGGPRPDLTRVYVEDAFEEWIIKNFTPKQLLAECNKILLAAGLEPEPEDGAVAAAIDKLYDDAARRFQQRRSDRGWMDFLGSLSNDELCGLAESMGLDPEDFDSLDELEESLFWMLAG